MPRKKIAKKPQIEAKIDLTAAKPKSKSVILFADKPLPQGGEVVELSADALAQAHGHAWFDELPPGDTSAAEVQAALQEVASHRSKLVICHRTQGKMQKPGLFTRAEIKAGATLLLLTGDYSLIQNETKEDVAVCSHQKVEGYFSPTGTNVDGSTKKAHWGYVNFMPSQSYFTDQRFKFTKPRLLSANVMICPIFKIGDVEVFGMKAVRDLNPKEEILCTDFVPPLSPADFLKEDYHFIDQQGVLHPCDKVRKENFLNVEFLFPSMLPPSGPHLPHQTYVLKSEFCRTYIPTLQEAITADYGATRVRIELSDDSWWVILRPEYNCRDVLAKVRELALERESIHDVAVTPAKTTPEAKSDNIVDPNGFYVPVTLKISPYRLSQQTHSSQFLLGVFQFSVPTNAIRQGKCLNPSAITVLPASPEAWDLMHGDDVPYEKAERYFQQIPSFDGVKAPPAHQFMHLVHLESDEDKECFQRFLQIPHYFKSLKLIKKYQQELQPLIQKRIVEVLTVVLEELLGSKGTWKINPGNNIVNIRGPNNEKTELAKQLLASEISIEEKSFPTKPEPTQVLIMPCSSRHLLILEKYLLTKCDKPRVETVAEGAAASAAAGAGAGAAAAAVDIGPSAPLPDMSALGRIAASDLPVVPVAHATAASAAAGAGVGAGAGVEAGTPNLSRQ